MSTALLDAGASLAWAPEHGDEALYVEQGAISVGGRICPAGGAVVIEAHSAPTIEAVEPARLVHMGARDAAPAASAAPAAPSAPSAPKVHVVGPRGVFEALEPGRAARFFADATCATCSVWLLLTSRSFAYESPIHSHAQDELIHVLRGEIRIGSLALGPGDTVFIAADQVYRFRSGSEGFAFLNYRRAASVMTIRPTGQQIVEAGAATGMVRVADGVSS